MSPLCCCKRMKKSTKEGWKVWKIELEHCLYREERAERGEKTLPTHQPHNFNHIKYVLENC